jgi:translation initiation factor IF-1
MAGVRPYNGRIPSTIAAVLRGAYEVRLANGHRVRAMLYGRMSLARIRVVAGDRVEVEMSGYDLHKGRIVRRL